MSAKPSSTAEIRSSIRIFLASPGDVPDERALARGAIQQIGAERAFRDRITLQVIAWDQPGSAVPLEGAMTPQAAIASGLPKPSECDLVVAIFWSRMGTRLPAEFCKKDGSAYLSGTEWEVLEALDAARNSQRPNVWIYRRREVPRIQMDAEDFQECHQQWKRVQAWFEGLINADGSLRAGVNEYLSPSEFQRDFEQHLRDFLVQQLESLDETSAPAPMTATPDDAREPWSGGNPYPGLEAFTEEQHGIFFGRSAETDELLAVIGEAQVQFLCVVGASGSGKSSLVAAGLVPRLQAGAISGSEDWRYVRLKPGERGGDPFLSLAFALKHTLGIVGVSESALADELRSNPDALGQHLDETGAPRCELLLFIDQFEEIFTSRRNAASTDRAEQTFLGFLDRVLSDAGIRVVATLRSDFYDRLAENEAFAARLRRNGTFTLAAPGLGALNEMITRPAQKAGIAIADNLRQRLLDDTGDKPGGLALLAFALNRLHETGRDGGEITLADYQAIEGVEGAIRQRAEAVLKRFGNLDDQQLAPIFAELVEVNEHDVATRRRTSMDRLAKNDARRAIVEALIEARLLVVAGDQNETQVDVAHEAVFSAWPRLSRWIEQNGARLRVQRNLERAARVWDEAGAKPFSHLPDRATLKSYTQAQEEVSETALRFLAAGRRRQRIWKGAIAGASAIAVVLLANAWLANREVSWNAVVIAVMALTGAYEGPPVVAIQPGRTSEPGRPRFDESFMMGSMDGDEDEQPPHEVRMARPYAIGRYEVTFDEYSAYALLTGTEVPHDEDWGRGVLPVINVSWEEAANYAAWLSQVTGNPFRLPTEAEWEYAARGGTSSRFWWGSKINENGTVWANCDGCGSEWDNRRTAPVGSFPANPYGIHDTAGNAYEWAQDCRHENYSGGPADGSAWLESGDGDCALRSIRGGSWDREAVHARPTNRYRYPLDVRYNYVGFRVARDLD